MKRVVDLKNKIKKEKIIIMKGTQKFYYLIIKDILVIYNLFRVAHLAQTKFTRRESFLWRYFVKVNFSRSL